MRGVALAVVLAFGAGCNSLLGIEDLTLLDGPPPDQRVTFEVREGVADYNLTKDTFITDAMPTTPHGDAADLQWSTTNNIHALLRFDDLFGAGMIPTTSTIQLATLELHLVEGTASGVLYEAASDWDEATTYNNLGANVGVSSEDRGFQVPFSFDATTPDKLTINVTQSVEAWRVDQAKNKGWIFVPTDGAVVRIGSREDPVLEQRPRLIIEIP